MEELKSIGSLAQLGAFGLLCAVAYWLMRYVPNWITAAAEERKAFAQSTTAAAAESRAANRESLTEFAAQMREERQSCERSTQLQREADERRHQELMAVIEKHHEETMRALAEHFTLTREGNHLVRDIAQNRAMQEALGRRRTPAAPKEESP